MPSAPHSLASRPGADLGLHELPLRTEAWVSRLDASNSVQDHDLLLRLLEIGFLPGEPVKVIAKGFPSADPIAVRVGHTTFALRHHEAALVRVTAMPPLSGGVA